MKKLLMASLVAVCVTCTVTAVACHSHTYADEWSYDASNHWHESTCGHDDGDYGAHTWVAQTDENGDTVYDVNGEVVYECSVCGASFDYSAWKKDSVGHWHAALKDDSAAIADYDEHSYEDGSTVCTVCGYDSVVDSECAVTFSYTVTISDTDYDACVIYTAVEYNGITVDVDGDTLAYGDTIAFTVEKSVFGYYTSGDSPIVYANDEYIEPDSDGVYTVKLEGDTEISVSNMRIMEFTIGGTGTADDPYTINSVVDWLYFAYVINDKDYFTSYSYNIAYWELACDLDFAGETIYIIGDGYSSSYSMFCGSFNGNGHTISNFALDNAVSGETDTYSSYIGLFGVVSAYEGVDTTISNLNVENFTIDATAQSDDMVIAGGLVGYGMGVNIINCSVDNCTINVTGNSTYYSYAAGIVGFLQSYVDENSGTVYYSSVQYSSATNIDLDGSGILYAFGGIVGRTYPYSSSAPVYIFNCYSTGVISNAIRAGGIAGMLGRYSSVQNCYSTADITAYSSISTTSAISYYNDTKNDDRYSYAGGIAGYAESDTVIADCFFRGEVSASAVSGSSYAKYGAIYGDCTEAGWEDEISMALVSLNNDGGTTAITSDYLKNTLGWNEVDWDFSATYPTINQESENLSFNVLIYVDGALYYTFTLNSEVDENTSQYIYYPVSYWYLKGSAGGGLDSYIRLTGTNERTYGYYFDAECTQRVPDAYVPMKGMTLYCKAVDCTSILGEYYVSGNGASAVITLYANGSYSYVEGAIYLDGVYEYDGEVITFYDSYFSRLASTATETQQATYYHFYAFVDANGDLNIYDGDEVVTLSSDYDDYGLTSMARFFSKDSPLVAASATNVAFSGGYYDASGNIYIFNKDYTGTYTIAGSTGTLTYTVSYANSVYTVTATIQSRNYTAVIENGKIVQLVYVRDADDITYLTAMDNFAGTWEKSFTSTKTYTFDGMGKWTYSYGAVNLSGTYDVVSDDEITFTRGSVTVTVTLASDGTLLVKESGGTESVGYYNVNSYAGVWYTAANKVTRYTLTLCGINGDGVGVVEFGSLDGLYYAADDNGDLYVYYGDFVYATITYDSTSGVLNASIYSSTYDDYLDYEFYLYDDLYGDWVSSITYTNGDNQSASITTLSFNGFGAYSVAATSDTSAVEGVVTVNGSAEVNYTLDKTTNTATFTYDGVTFTLVYDENTEMMTASCGGSVVGIIAKTDDYAETAFIDENGVVYSFDGRGNFTDGGVAYVGETEAVYTVDSDGVITITLSGATYTITPNTTGYTLSDGSTSQTLRVQNDFTGVWVVSGGETIITVGDVYYIPADGETAEISGKYNGTDVTLTFNGEYMTFTYNETTYYLIAVGTTSKGLALSTSETLGTDATYLAAQDDLYGTWTASDGSTIYFDGCGNSAFVNGTATITSADGNTTTTYRYKVNSDDGTVKLYLGTALTASYTFNICESTEDGAYSQGGVYRALNAA